MGTGGRRPKRAGLAVGKVHNAPYGELEDAVKDLIVTGSTDDSVLDYLVGLTLTAIGEARPLFPNLLEEPYFYQRYFRKWVAEGLEELRKIAESETALTKEIQGTG